MAKNIIYYRGQTYDRIRSGNCYLVTSLPFSELEANTLSVVLESDDTSLTDFRRGAPLVFQHGTRQVGTFYVQDVQRIAPNQYEFNATSAIGILSEGKHYGGIYTGITVQELVADICGTVPFIIKNSLQNVNLYGLLPIATARENLAQVLFAIGATVTTDLSGVLRIEGIWDGFSGATGPNRLCLGSKVAYSAKVTQVSVTEHQYLALGEETQLYEGTTEQGDMITFDEPMFDLVVSGFTILESNANYARVSSGSGTLMGKPYTHNTRTVVRSVSEADRPNVKTVENATLISLANSTAVAERMAEFYKCIQTIEAPTIYTGERPGDRRFIFHPYDRNTVDACVKSVDINISNTLKAQEKSLVAFAPPSPGDVEYFDYYELISQNGEWTVPDGITVLRVVLIGGGQGGYSGNPGEDSPAQKVITDTSEVTAAITYYIGTNPTNPGNGGDPGEPGHGGKVWQTTLDVQPGQKFQITIGVGGVGGTAGYESVAGSEGGATLFGDLSSESGGVLPGGFLEEFDGTLYAGTGNQGMAGGRGAGRSNDSGSWQDIPADTFVIDGVTYGPGASGTNLEDEAGNYASGNGYVESTSAGGYGGGPAYKANGKNGGSGTASASSSYASSKGGSGGGGADAQPPAKETVYGQGGVGGNGGGGAGSSGGGVSSNRLKKSAGLTPATIRAYVATPGKGGMGSAGGQGADGCVILYYRKPKPVQSGAIEDKNGKFFLDRLGRLCVV